MNYDEIKDILQEAEASRNKIAMFHYIALKYADIFKDENPEEFCIAVGMEKSFKAEFSKMRALSQLMREKGLSL